MPNFFLHSHVAPAVPAGAYKIEVTQDVQVSGATKETLESHLEVTAPRYVLPHDQILSTFPPNEASGEFSSRLPHVVIRRRTLPWERDAEPTMSESGPFPWVALVVVADGEAQFKPAVPIADCVTSGVTLDGRNDAVVGDCLTVTSAVVKATFPAADELPLLTHVREVDLSDTELALGDDDGWLAVVVANRLPQPGTHYRACLISVERQTLNLSHSAFYQDEPEASALAGEAAVGARAAAAVAPPGAAFVPPAMQTYPVLATWTFTCTGAGDFQSIAQGLDVGVLGALPPPAPMTGSKPAEPPRRATPPEVLSNGLIGLDHISREGEPGRKWYRGPLIPSAGTRDQQLSDGTLPLMHTSDQARRIGPDGRENLSLATAFEIGRLLALGEPRIVAELLLWRRQGFPFTLVAALIAQEPALGSLGIGDVGEGFAARAGLRLLESLGADDAARLGPTRPLVDPVPPLPEAGDRDPLEIIARGFDLDVEALRELAASGVPATGLAVPEGLPLADGLESLAERAETEFAALRALLDGNGRETR